MRVVLAALLALGVGSCGETPAEPVDYNRLTYSGHCVNGLNAAVSQGLIGGTNSALQFPWSITRSGGTDTQPELICAVTEDGQPKSIRVQVVCPDDEREACTTFKGLVSR